MFYRVAYAFSLILAGALFGALLSTRTASVSWEGIARGLYIVLTTLSVLGVFALISTRIWQPTAAAAWVSGVAGDLLKFASGFLVCLPLGWPHRREYRISLFVLGAFTIMLVMTFATSGTLNALGVTSMLEFFHKSRYSAGFLSFILSGEVFGAIGLLLPWARSIACIGLSVDMFGAVLTHVHNADPLNDSTGALVALARFAVLGSLIFLFPTKWNPEPQDAPLSQGRSQSCHCVSSSRLQGRRRRAILEAVSAALYCDREG